MSVQVLSGCLVIAGVLPRGWSRLLPRELQIALYVLVGTLIGGACLKMAYRHFVQGRRWKETATFDDVAGEIACLGERLSWACELAVDKDFDVDSEILVTAIQKQLQIFNSAGKHNAVDEMFRLTELVKVIAKQRTMEALPVLMRLKGSLGLMSMRAIDGPLEKEVDCALLVILNLQRDCIPSHLDACTPISGTPESFKVEPDIDENSNTIKMR